MIEEICPFCGKEYTRLSVHLLYCKEKPVDEELEEEAVYKFDDTTTFRENVDEDVELEFSVTPSSTTPLDIEDIENILSPVYTVNLPPIPFDTPIEEITSTISYEEPTEDTPSIPCTYLVVIAGSGCSSCKGTTCMASRDKKISNDDFCKTEWLDCLIREEALKDGVRASCPYISLTVPEGRYSCTGMWCHARNKAVKVSKRCRNWSACGPFLEAKSDGKPFYRKAIK